jgi:hypothetical protein
MEPLPTDYNNLALLQRLLSTLEEASAYQVGSGLPWPGGGNGGAGGSEAYALTSRPPIGNEAADLLALFPKTEQEGPFMLSTPRVEVPCGDTVHHYHNNPTVQPATVLFEQERELLKRYSAFTGGSGPQNVGLQYISHPQGRVPPEDVAHKLTNPPNHSASERKSQSSISVGNVCDHESRVEHFRRKNREAQQRFRERKRANLQAALERWESMADELDKLESENLALQGRIGMLERVLFVRNTFVDALSRYPVVPEPAKSSVDKVDTQEGKSDPKDKDEELYSVAVKLNTPELYTLYLCRWQAELKHLFLWAKEDGPLSLKDETWTTQIQDHFHKMTKIWSFNVELYGQNFPQVLLGLLPEAGSKEEPWEDVAKTLLDCLDVETITKLNTSWQSFLQKMTMMDEEWKSQLEKLLRASNYDQVAESTCRLEKCSNDRWKACVELGVDWLECLGDYNSALCNVESLPFVPDWLGITNFVIFLAKGRGLL